MCNANGNEIITSYYGSYQHETSFREYDTYSTFLLPGAGAITNLKKLDLTKEIVITYSANNWDTGNNNYVVAGDITFQLFDNVLSALKAGHLSNENAKVALMTSSLDMSVDYGRFKDMLNGVRQKDDSFRFEQDKQFTIKIFISEDGTSNYVYVNGIKFEGAIKIVRLLCYLPVLIPGIVFGQIWMDMLGHPEGLINSWLVNLGLPKQTFFSAEATQLSTLIVVSQWGIGGGMIVWLAALENIPSTLYEAADIDGAKYYKKLFKITLPMSTPIIFYNLISAVIGCLQTFDSYAYLGRGENDATYFISIRIYVTAFEGTVHQYGFACAMAWILFIIIAVLTGIMFKSSKWVFYGE